MFMFTVAFSLSLIAMTASVTLYYFALRAEGPGVNMARGFGLVILLLSTLCMVFTFHSAVRAWKENYISKMAYFSQFQLQNPTTMTLEQINKLHTIPLKK